MSRIKIDISSVRRSNEELRQNNFKLPSISCDIFQSMCNVDANIQARRNIGQRLKNTYDEFIKIEKKLVQLEKFISSSMDRYEKADKEVEEQANALRILMDLRMRTGMEFDLISQMSGTSSAYVSENDKIFYDGDKVSDDEDVDEILKETDDLLKEINEEEDNDWRNKPAKKDIFDKFTDWLTEKLTGEKASPKTQGEEVIDAQLTTMSFDEQNILADIASDYQTAFRGLASADRINEALENFEEEPVFSSGNNTKVVAEAPVWNNITGTAKNMEGTKIPSTFQIKLGEGISYTNPTTGSNVLWTNANATEHMGEYVSRFGTESESIGIRSQEMLESYSASLNEAMADLSQKAPGRYFAVYGNWQLGINTETGVVYHAKMLK